jgi:DNA mismatch repair protein MutS
LWNDASAIYDLRDWLGLVDAYTALATMPICIVKYSTSNGVNIKGLVHPYLESCVPNNYDSTGHSVLTGPNRGGKSTFCKALGLALVTAQSWGFAAAESMILQPFGAIHTALEPAGKLGYASTFEAEIVFAKAVLDRDERPLFVMMDEIFHSTNAVDGIRASSVFMSSLYTKQDTMSLISTHYRELATKFNGACAAYKMVASDGPNGLLYTYKIESGVSDKSSVDELLRSYGLLGPGTEKDRGFQEQKNDAAESE